jgi:CRP-like cAMP-binding protein
MVNDKEARARLVEVVAAIPLFHSLSAEQAERLGARARLRQMTRAEIVVHKGDQPQGLFVVTAGQIMLTLVSSAGNEKIIELVSANQAFGEVALLTESAYPFYAQAVRAVSLLFVPRDVVQELLEQSPGFACAMLTSLALRTQNLLQDVETYTQHTSSTRVVSYLRQLCQNIDEPGDSIAVTLPTTKQIIASRLNLSPETLSRILHELIEAKLIAVNGRQIRIASRERLQSYHLDAA